MENGFEGGNVTRRGFVGGLALALFGVTGTARGMGLSGSFSARRLLTAGTPGPAERDTGLVRWGWELVRRTSAPARLTATTVGASDSALLKEPFVIWSGSKDVAPLIPAERRGLESFLRLGGILVVDDADPVSGQFSRAVRRELRQILPESPVSRLEPSHVLYKTFYLVPRPQGRLLGPERIDAIVRGTQAQVLFLACDLLGALSTKADGTFLFDTEPSAPRSREFAIRFAVNIAMYVLCSDYKDDQVHAPWLMRRRARWNP
ncbi:MAG: DUF4159 domain-containing protein [Polyangiaceae bacterium]